MKKLVYDERTSQVTGRVSQIVLSMTHIVMGAIILYRAYVLDQPPGEFADFQVLFAVSMLGNLFCLLYFGGYMPVITLKHSLRLYLISVVLLFGTFLVLSGVPSTGEWASTILPFAVGPALIIGLYYIVAQMGQRRIEKMSNKGE
jgi:hypothetical protein